MNDFLGEHQLRRMSELFRELMSTSIFRSPSLSETEPEFTSRVLRPGVENWVANVLKKRDLVVRGDGSANVPRPLVLGDLAFRPDIEIVQTGQRCLAVEVKFLREGQDPTGSLAKALGQCVIYREMGFYSSHAVLMDLRPLPSERLPALPNWDTSRAASIDLHWFVGSGDGTFSRR